MLCLLLSLPLPLLGKTRCGVICLYFSCCRLMSPGCGGFGGLGMGLVGAPGARWAAGTCSVPPLSKPQSEQSPSKGTLQLPPSAGGPTGMALLGCPQGMGTGTVKPSLAFSFFSFPFLMMIIFTVI